MHLEELDPEPVGPREQPLDRLEPGLLVARPPHIGDGRREELARRACPFARDRSTASAPVGARSAGSTARDDARPRGVALVRRLHALEELGHVFRPRERPGKMLCERRVELVTAMHRGLGGLRSRGGLVQTPGGLPVSIVRTRSSLSSNARAKHTRGTNLASRSRPETGRLLWRWRYRLRSEREGSIARRDLADEELHEAPEERVARADPRAARRPRHPPPHLVDDLR